MHQIFRYNLFFLFIVLLSNNTISQTVRINEVVSSNTILKDGDGDTPDWIELYNYGISSQNLNGWSISDKEDEPNKWVFPDITLLPNEYIQIYASSKDRKYRTYPRTVLKQGDLVKYLIPTSEPPSAWKTIDYDDSFWSEGSTGIGYGDDDDSTLVPEGTNAVYIRHSFDLVDFEKVLCLVFDVDYDDGFVAYINGIEISRENVFGENPSYLDCANNEHEAGMVDGLKPCRYYIELFDGLIQEGENMFSIQLFNHDPTSSDLSMIPFLTAIYVELSNVGITPPEILELPNRKLHTNFKIASEGEPVILSNDLNEMVDQIPAKTIPANYSIGRKDNGGEIYYFPNPTPEAENNGISYNGYIENKVVLSRQSGFPEEPFSLSMHGNTDNQYIRYTTDATEPNEESLIYTNPIYMDSNMVIRASIFQEGFIPSEIQNRTYIFEQNTALDAVFLTTDPVNFFDEDYGIYVYGPEGTYDSSIPHYGANFWEDWERPIHFAFHEKETNEIGVEFNAGVKIYGNWSRGMFEQRSLALYARSSYGDSNFEYPFFERLNYDKFENLILRNTGQDFLYSSVKDISLTSLMSGSGLEYQDYRSVATFINGEYWGMYHLREKVNEHMLASKADVKSEEINLLSANAETLEGCNEEYLELLNYVDNTDLSDDANFEYIKEQIDIDNYIIYQATEIYLGNYDWPGSNIKYWKTEDGKWRWILYDIDQSFGRWRHPDNYDIPSLNLALADDGPEWPNPPWSTFLFRNLITNIGFRNDFINRLADEMNSRFLPEIVNNHFDTISESIQSEVEAHYSRWDGDPVNQSLYLDSLHIWAELRPDIMKDQLMSEFGLPAYHRITITNDHLSEGFVKVNGNLKIQKNVWSGDYFETVAIELKAIPQLGYKFSNWTGASNSTEAIISMNLEKDETLIPHFTLSDDEAPLVINEFNFDSSPDFDPGDWIELYNPNDFDMDLSNWILKDKSDYNVFYLEEGSIIKADSFLVIARKPNKFLEIYPEVENYVGNLNFGLSSYGDAIRLFNDEEILQDQVVFDVKDPWSECASGTGQTFELVGTTLDNSLAENWTCINHQGSPGCDNELGYSIQEVNTNHFKCYPNPVNQLLFIDGIEKQASFKLTSLTGQEVCSGLTNKKIDVSSIDPGVYIVEIMENIKYSRLKLIKQ